MSRPEKYVVVIEIPKTGFMECTGVYDNAEQAYGEAYLSLCDGLEPKDYYITFPEDRTGECGCVLSAVRKESQKEEMIATVLFYRKHD